MRRSAMLTAAILLATCALHAQSTPYIEVTGSATLNIVPDRVTIEIGIEEYYKQRAFGDSTVVKLADIEKGVRNALNRAGVADSEIIVAGMGNYRRRDISSDFLMAKTLSATVSDLSRLETIAEHLDRKGIVSFNITGVTNSDMERYDRQGLKAALDAARSKAEFIAENEELTITVPYEIVENGQGYNDAAMMSNVAFDSGAGMESMRRIVKRYSVRVRYLFDTKNTK